MDNLRGSLFMIVAMALFAVEDSFIKAATATISVGQVLLILGALGGGFFAYLARRKGIALFTSVLMSKPIVIRNVAELLGTMAFVTALSRIPLSTAAAMIQATPLMMTMGAALLLREPVGWRRWSAIVIGLFGVLLILRPGSAGFDPYVLSAFFGVAMLATRDLAARYVPRDVSNLQLSAYGLGVLVPAGLVLMLLNDGMPVAMDAPTWGLMVGAAAFGVGGYYAVTVAARLGDVSHVTPFRYTRLLFALAIGVTFFSERPDQLTLLGAAIVIATGLYTLLREARLRKRNGL